MTLSSDTARNAGYGLMLSYAAAAGISLHTLCMSVPDYSFRRQEIIRSQMTQSIDSSRRVLAAIENGEELADRVLASERWVIYLKMGAVALFVALGSGSAYFGQAYIAVSARSQP